LGILERFGPVISVEVLVVSLEQTAVSMDL